ncbi:MAG: nucleoside deaminase [Patescibacteria group bacterium]|nr:nucleoside deaminase [Patescibacteria group bacterium]MDE2438605.1 nucleoside deaminase [Patescibacteria group bacterium]
MHFQDITYMQHALQEARRALQEDELPVGAIVVLNGAVCGVGRRSHTGHSRFDHAEMIALRIALETDYKNAHDMTLYTTLEPCIMCFGAILNSRIGRIVYALEDPYGGAASLKPHHLPVRHHAQFPVIERGVLRENARALFQIFFQTTKHKFWNNHSENPLVRTCLTDR